MNEINDYDPVGGHTKLEADAAYEALFQELHGESIYGGAAQEPQAALVHVICASDADTDCICAALCYARLKNQLRPEVLFKACTVSPVQEETRSLLARFGAKPPEALADAKINELILLGTSDPALLPAGLSNAHILEIVDIHALGGLCTSTPLHCRIEPLCALSTLIGKLFFEADTEPDPETATLLCAGITHATRRFSAPDTTRTDRTLAATLANIAGIDLSGLLLT